jgi:hypothetical protein
MWTYVISKYAKRIAKKNCIVGNTKDNNTLIKFEDLKYTYSDLCICYFCVSQNTKYLKMIFCMLIE